jgi:hypothetical protein
MKYSDIVAIAIAAFTFTEIGVSVHGIVTTRKNREPIMEAVKLTNFSTSLISLVLTEAALMSLLTRVTPLFIAVLQDLYLAV